MIQSPSDPIQLQRRLMERIDSIGKKSKGQATALRKALEALKFLNPPERAPLSDDITDRIERLSRFNPANARTEMMGNLSEFASCQTELDARLLSFDDALTSLHESILSGQSYTKALWNVQHLLEDQMRLSKMAASLSDRFDAFLADIDALERDPPRFEPRPPEIKALLYLRFLISKALANYSYGQRILLDATRGVDHRERAERFLAMSIPLEYLADKHDDAFIRMMIGLPSGQSRIDRSDPLFDLISPESTTGLRRKLEDQNYRQYRSSIDLYGRIIAVFPAELLLREAQTVSSLGDIRIDNVEESVIERYFSSLAFPTIDLQDTARSLNRMSIGLSLSQWIRNWSTANMDNAEIKYYSIGVL